MTLDKIIPPRKEWIADLKEQTISYYIYDPWDDQYYPYIESIGLMQMRKDNYRYEPIPYKSSNTAYLNKLQEVVEKAMEDKNYKIPKKPTIKKSYKKRGVKKGAKRGSYKTKKDREAEYEKKRQQREKMREYQKKRKQKEIERKKNLLKNL